MKTILFKKLTILTVVLMTTFTIKSQSHQWSTRIGAAGQDVSNEIQRDASGNVLTVGNFSATVDFDPGAGVTNLSATGTNVNGYVLKQTNLGAFVWARTFVGAGACNVTGITTDPTGNVYVTGIFSGVIDFDPGAGTFTLATSSATNNNLFTCKLTSAGAFVWANEIGNNYDDGGTSIALDGTNNVYVSGYANASSQTNTINIDLDPGAAVANFNVAGTDGILVKLDNNGNYLLGQEFGYFARDHIYKVRTDISNNVYIAGDYEQQIPYLAAPSYSFAIGYAYIAKLTSTFVKTWVIEYHGSGSQVGNAVMDIAIDGSGNVYSTGLFKDVIDFDPSSTSTFTLASPSTTDYDVFVTKVNSSGGFLWADKIAAGTGSASGNGISLDPLSNVFVTGYFAGTADFNPGGTAFNKTSSGGNDIFVCKLNSAGVFSNDAQTYGGTGNDIGQGIQCAGIGNYYLTGYFSGVVDFDASSAVNSLSSAGGLDAFTAYYTSCTVPPLTSAITPTVITICANTATVLSVTASSGVTYNWYAGPGGGASLGAGNSYTTSVITVASDFWAEGTNTCAATARTQFSINVIASPTVNITSSSSSVCAGSTTTLTASGASTYSWSAGGSGTSISVSPTVTTVYTATGIAASGCRDTQTLSVTVGANPTVSITAPSPSVCSGSSVTLTASGAATYTWSGGGSGTTKIVSPTITTVYTSTGTAANGCKDTQTISITTAANPTVNISASSTTACAGSSVSLTASGASTYSWSSGGSGTTTTISPTITTVYTSTGTAANGCKDTQTISVAVSANPTVNIAASTPSICTGSTATLTASGAATYTWSSGGSGTAINVSPTVTTVYTATGTAASGCKDTQTLSLTVTTTPTLVTNNYTICAGGTATLITSGASTYSWSTGATSSSITVTPATSTNYTVTGTNGGACSNTRTLSVTVGSALSILITPSTPTICIGNSGTITASGASTYTWSTGSNSTSIVITPATTVNYTVTGTSGSCSGTNTISIAVSANPTVAATSSSSLICTGNSATLSATGASSYNWNPGSLSGASIAVTPTASTTYTVVGSNAAGCTNTKTVSVTVSACTGINEAQAANGTISIYPNPNNGEFNLVVPEQGVYAIINSIGQTIETIEVKENSQTISVQGLADGIYYVIGKTSKAKIVVSK